MQQDTFDHLKLPLRIAPPETKSPLPVFRCGPYDIGNDVDVPLICPTRQAQKALRHTDIKWKLWALERNALSDRTEAVDVLCRYRPRGPVRLVLCSKPSRDRLVWRCHVPIRQP